MGTSGELIRLINYVDDIVTTLRRIQAFVPGMEGEAGNTNPPGFITIPPSATSGTIVAGGSPFPVSNVTGYISGTGPWTISGVCWYHF